MQVSMSILVDQFEELKNARRWKTIKIISTALLSEKDVTQYVTHKTYVFLAQ